MVTISMMILVVNIGATISDGNGQLQLQVEPKKFDDLFSHMMSVVSNHHNLNNKLGCRESSECGDNYICFGGGGWGSSYVEGVCQWCPKSGGDCGPSWPCCDGYSCWVLAGFKCVEDF